VPIDKTKFEEVWVHTPGGQMLCALINGDLGWLMYLRGEGDAGFSSRNPSYSGSPNAQIEYFLSNGQRDEYPASWALPIAEVRRALDYFQREQEPPPFITWHNDSGDGVVIGESA
jgi:hypothetical protein